MISSRKFSDFSRGSVFSAAIILVLLFGSYVEQFLDVYRELHHLLGAEPRAVAVEHHAGLDPQGALEERAVVAHPRAVVDMLGGGVETFARIEPVLPVGQSGRRVGRVVAQRLEILAQVEVVFDFDAPFADRDVQLSAAGLAPEVVDAAAALRGEEEVGPDVEVEISVELPACVGIEQQVVRHVFVALAPCEVEHRERIAEIESLVYRVASGREDAEHLARGVGVHAFPVDGHFHIGLPVRGRLVAPHESRQPVVVVGRRIAEKGARVVAHQFLAVENTRIGLHVFRVELIVENRARLGQEFRVVAEVLQQVGTHDQAVFLLPLHADAGREPGAEERLGFAEFVGGVFAVVEACGEVGSDNQILRIGPPPQGKGEDEQQRGLFQGHGTMRFEPPKIDKIFFICYFWPRKQRAGERYAKNYERRTGASDARRICRQGKTARAGGARQRAFGAERRVVFPHGRRLCGGTCGPVRHYGRAACPRNPQNRPGGRIDRAMELPRFDRGMRAAVARRGLRSARRRAGRGGCDARCVLPGTRAALCAGLRQRSGGCGAGGCRPLPRSSRNPAVRGQALHQRRGFGRGGAVALLREAEKLRVENRCSLSF